MPSDGAEAGLGARRPERADAGPGWPLLTQSATVSPGKTAGSGALRVRGGPGAQGWCPGRQRRPPRDRALLGASSVPVPGGRPRGRSGCEHLLGCSWGWGAVGDVQGHPCPGRCSPRWALTLSPNPRDSFCFVVLIALRTDEFGTDRQTQLLCFGFGFCFVSVWGPHPELLGVLNYWLCTQGSHLLVPVVGTMYGCWDGIGEVGARTCKTSALPAEL